MAADPTISVVLSEAGLACCSIEVEAAIWAGLLIPEPDEASGKAVVDEVESTVLIVAGTLTGPLVAALEAQIAQMPGDTVILSFGACATSGGPYWDSPTVLPGIAQTCESGNDRVATYVPGCPPRPEALVDALIGLTARAGGRA